MTQPQHPTPEPVKGGIDYVEETRKILGAAMIFEKNENPVELLRNICDRARQEERERVLDEVGAKIYNDNDLGANGKYIVSKHILTLRTKPVPLKENDHR